MRAFGIPGPTARAARARVSPKTFFHRAVSHQGREPGRARGAAGPGAGAGGGGRVLTPACKHTLPPPLRRDRVRFFFAFTFRLLFFFFFSIRILPFPTPLTPPPILWSDRGIIY